MSRWIDADVLKANCDIMVGNTTIGRRDYVMFHEIDSAPSIDIVRCQDCKYWVYNFNGCARNPCTEPWYATDFCNYGERRE